MGYQEVFSREGLQNSNQSKKPILCLNPTQGFKSNQICGERVRGIKRSDGNNRLKCEVFVEPDFSYSSLLFSSVRQEAFLLCVV